MPRRRPRLDLTLPDLARQVAEFCAEFPQHDYDLILHICEEVEEEILRVRYRERPAKA